jgi:TFIIF-interacting CTD phosphatase-like protein
MKDKPLYKPFKSKAKGRKMSVYVMKDGKKKLIHFGDSSMQDFTQHKDQTRRKSYLARSAGIRNKEGKLTKDDKTSPNYWSRRVLWKAP